MRKQDHIIALIKSLSGTEKRHFVQTAKADKRSKGYLNLYYELLSTDTYNAEDLSLKLGKKKVDLANEKKYLERVLMKTLRSIRADQPHLKPINTLLDASILIDKGLFELAEGKLNRTIEEAKKVSLHNIEWLAHGLMLTVASEPNASTKETQSLAATHLEGLNSCAKKMSRTSEIERLSFEIYEAYDNRHFDRTEADRKETEELIKHPFLNTVHEDEHVEFQKFNLLTLLYSRLRDTEATVNVTSKWVNQVELQHHIEPNEYITALSCHAQALISHGDVQKIKGWLSDIQSDRYQNLPVDKQRMQTLVTKYLYWHQSSAYYLLAHNKEKLGADCSDFIDDHLREWEDTIKVLTPNHFITATVRTACCSLLMNRKEDALSMLNRLFDDFDRDAHPQRWGQSKILYAMTLLSLGEYRIFPSAVKNAIYFLKKRNLYGGLDKIVLGHLFTIPEDPTDLEVLESLKLFNKKVKGWKAENPDVTLLEHLPYLIWVESWLKDK